MQNVLKNKKVVMIVAMVLMVALVAGMGAMTYSRYVSSADMGPAATATVAKWGYVVTFQADNMFPSLYETDGVPAAPAFAVKAAEGDDVVSATANGAIVAPGTKGSMNIVVSGVAEVLAQFKISLVDCADVSLVKADGTTYNPIKWTLTNGATTVVNRGSLTELAEELSDYTKKIAPSATISDTFTITWEWDLDSGNDDLDTILGLLAAGKSLTTEQAAKVKTGTTPVTTISFDLSAEVKQIQD